MIQSAQFDQLVGSLYPMLASDESLVVNLTAERSQFARFNASKVRQIGTVEDALLELKIQTGEAGSFKEASGGITLTGDAKLDFSRAEFELKRLQKEARLLPVNPYLSEVRNNGKSRSVREGRILDPKQAAQSLLPPMGRLTLTGLYSAGRMIRANANSCGQSHWFETDQFTLDYSVDPGTGGDHAVKGEFSGLSWDDAAFARELESAAHKSESLRLASRKLARGKYRVFLSPGAMHELVAMFSWGALSEAAIRQGDSPLIRLRSGEFSFSSKFSLSEDFRPGDVPRFNEEGELSPEHLELIRNGSLVNTLISATTSREYGVTANGASRSETLRSPSVGTGKLEDADVLARLGEGIYLSNLHYLNWSDQPGGRVTGMTRHACFWVENGKFVAPIQNMRWDDTLFSLLGPELEDLSSSVIVIPSTGSYGFRQLGASRIPGALVRGMEFTL